MRRKTFDLLVSSAGAVAAIALLLVGVLVLVGANFANSNVTDNLRPQNISFPSAAALKDEGITNQNILDHAGQKVENGGQAKVYSEYIDTHLKKINGGKTYSETSTEARANPSDTALAGKVDTLFRGEMLRATLLNAYGWWFVSQVAMWAGYTVIVLALIMLVLTALGFRHLRRTPETAQL
ncbi:hypothetical protein ACQP00_20850 [Dactylosporangium sp. CS-047395]|uniref:hypothetical protein n=1 Tax=Dactylosporangium sp. CS-047395 TaxID=3239936 RepID=UPI003D8AB095